MKGRRVSSLVHKFASIFAHTVHSKTWRLSRKIGGERSATSFQFLSCTSTTSPAANSFRDAINISVFGLTAKQSHSFCRIVILTMLFFARGMPLVLTIQCILNFRAWPAYSIHDATSCRNSHTFPFSICARISRSNYWWSLISHFWVGRGLSLRNLSHVGTLSNIITLQLGLLSIH